MHEQNIKAMLKNISLLQTLEPIELDYILPFVKSYEFSANTLIIQQGKIGNGMYIIKQGSVQINIRLPGNIENKIASLTEQDFFGEIAFIDGGVTTASVITLNKTHCYFISCDYFKMLQLCAPIIAHKICTAIDQGVSKRLHHINQQLIGRLVDIKKMPYFAKRAKLSKPTLASLTELENRKINSNFLITLGVFKIFNAAELSELFSHMKLRKAARGCIVFDEKDQASAFYIVAQGAVQTMVAKNNKLSKLSVIGPGGIFGLLAYFEKTIYSATALAREEIVILEFQYAEMKLLQHNNEILFYKWHYVISQTLVMMLRAADKDLIRLASRLN